jgi:hypothetical protein
VGDLEVTAGATVNLSASSIAALTNSVVAAYKKWLADGSVAPRYSKLAAASLADSDGWVALKFGPVPQGRRWVVRNVVVGGVNWSTTADGTAVLVVQASDPAKDQDIILANVWDQANTLPLPAQYGRGELFANALESVWLVIEGGTSGQLYTGAIRFVDEPAGS